MKSTTSFQSDIPARGEKIYVEKLRAIIEPGHDGEIVVINVDTGEYEVDKDHLAALDRARARWPNAIFFATRVGFPALAHIGSCFNG